MYVCCFVCVCRSWVTINKLANKQQTNRRPTTLFTQTLWQNVGHIAYTPPTTVATAHSRQMWRPLTYSLYGNEKWHGKGRECGDSCHRHCCCCLSIYGLGGKMKHTPGSRAASTYKQTTQPTIRDALPVAAGTSGLSSFAKYLS